jgi:hypothetical protein
LQYWTVVPLPHFFVVVENRCDFTNPMWVYRVVVFLYLPDLLGTRIFSTSLSFGLSGWSSKVDCDDILCRQFNTPFVVFDVWFRHCNRFFLSGMVFACKGLPRLAAQFGRGLFFVNLRVRRRTIFIALLYQCARIVVRNNLYCVLTLECWRHRNLHPIWLLPFFRFQNLRGSVYRVMKNHFHFLNARLAPFAKSRAVPIEQTSHAHW